MKNQMDNNTILFKGDSYSISYDEAYFKKYYKDIIDKVKDSEYIFYKYNEFRSSWFNIKNSFNLLNGFEAEKYFNGFRLHKLSGTLVELPETQFTDQYGYIHRIAKRDGLSIMNVVPRFPMANITKVVSIDFSGNLIVDFNVDISNALITLNHVFYPYVKVTNNRIKFLQAETFYNSNEPSENKIEVFIWENLLKQPAITPISRDEEWFVFENNVDPNCVFIYNGVMYLFERNLNNLKKIRLVDISVADYSLFDISKMALIKFVHTNPQLEVVKVDMEGNNNYAQNFSQFTEPVNNAMVLYNGIFHEYTLNGTGSIVNYAVPQELSSFVDGIVSATQFVY